MGDFYDSSYVNFAAEVYGEVRAEAFGDDLGQNGWLTADELQRFVEWSHIGPDTRVLDVGCGSGGPAVRLAEQMGCSVYGIDGHGDGIAQANATAVRCGFDDRVHFDTLDANKPLPLPSASFDVVMCIDAVNHLADRGEVLAEWARLLRPGGRVLYTDPMVVSGALSHKEIVARSATGFFLFVPPGENERRIRDAGLELVVAEDATINVAAVAGRWLAARAAREEPLRELEGDDTYHDTQEFLSMVELLARERRLSRFVFVAERPAGS
jgi:SAM-dependent methyltransferase